MNACGDHLAAHISNSNHPHASAVFEKCKNRNSIETTEILSTRLGISPTKLTALELKLRSQAKITGSTESLWEIPANDNTADTELQAVARMAHGGNCSLEMHAAILASIKGIPLVTTPELNDLTSEAAQVVDFSKEPYVQGYEVARWLRGKLGVASGRVEPEDILRHWNVQLVDINVDSNKLDAIACWGPRHGPAVLLNRNGPHAQDELGARSTLAHEIAHLLLDRHGSLPLAEVLGGNAPAMPEKRARAFAAEFLLPQSIVEMSVQESTTIAGAVQSLRMEYAVSKQIVGWQIANSSAWSLLDDEDCRYIEELTTA